MDISILRLRLNRQGINFKNSKTGNVDNIQAGELTEGIWPWVALGHGLKLLMRNGHVYKYDGFGESEFEKLSDFLKTHYCLELMEKDLCVKGWNWGTVKFCGQLLSPHWRPASLRDPSQQCVPVHHRKEWGDTEFHQNDDTEVSLMEVVDPDEAFSQNVLSKADVISRQLLRALGGPVHHLLQKARSGGLLPECTVKGGRDAGHQRRHLHLPGAALSDSLRPL
uniref:FACT complex subunit SSRP1/POB3 N-terminal PH domain-containing protein n=1 Tax=Bos mutus grunniens TaxID=30521 RepID=A0A8B9X9Y8_BOSMU